MRDLRHHQQDVGAVMDDDGVSLPMQARELGLSQRVCSVALEQKLSFFHITRML